LFVGFGGRGLLVFFLSFLPLFLRCLENRNRCPQRVAYWEVQNPTKKRNREKSTNVAKVLLQPWGLGERPPGTRGKDAEPHKKEF